MGASINYSPEFLDTEPNYNLLRRIIESGRGKILDPAIPSVNPFLHERQKTYQPHDLWESLLAFAILLFVFDVGVRRIQIDRDEWQRAMRFFELWILFWKAAPRTVESEVSLAALLARREHVRSTHTAPASAEPKAELFRPVGPLTETLPGAEPEPVPVPAATDSSPEPAKPQAEPASTTTSRLLEAKRRAQQRKK